VSIGDNVHFGFKVGIGSQKLIAIGSESRSGDGSIILDTDWHGFDGKPS
jgi:hypothetical protein